MKQFFNSRCKETCLLLACVSIPCVFGLHFVSSLVLKNGSVTINLSSARIVSPTTETLQHHCTKLTAMFTGSSYKWSPGRNLLGNVLTTSIIAMLNLIKDGAQIAQTTVKSPSYIRGTKLSTEFLYGLEISVDYFEFKKSFNDCPSTKFKVKCGIEIRLRTTVYRVPIYFLHFSNFLFETEVYDIHPNYLFITHYVYE